MKLSKDKCALVAQLDRVTGYEPVGQGFESLPARQTPKRNHVWVFFYFLLLEWGLEPERVRAQKNAPGARFAARSGTGRYHAKRGGQAGQVAKQLAKSLPARQTPKRNRVWVFFYFLLLEWGLEPERVRASRKAPGGKLPHDPSRMKLFIYICCCRATEAWVSFGSCSRLTGGDSPQFGCYKASPFWRGFCFLKKTKR